MTKNKNQKTRIRSRMARTGESYTAARAQLLIKRPEATVNYAALAQMKDSSIERKTHKDWAQWCEALDEIGALKMNHKAIAAEVNKRWPEIDGWWTQAVTVGYERIRGLREVGHQSSDKLFAASKTRTFGVPVAQLFRAFREPQLREGWIGAEVGMRSAKVDTSIRFDWPRDQVVNASFVDKGPYKSTVSVMHRKLVSQEERAQAKEQWAQRFDRLSALLDAMD